MDEDAVVRSIREWVLPCGDVWRIALVGTKPCLQIQSDGFWETIEEWSQLTYLAFTHLIWEGK